MKKLIAFTFAVLLLATVAHAKESHRVKPHIRKDGTFVEGHRRTNPDRSKFNNFSTEGNTNPFTGKEGTEDPFKIEQPKRQRRR